MNREDIIRMAQEAHFNSKTWIDIYKDEITAGDVKGFLEAFAALIASAERESLRESFRVVTAAEASAAILHERKACADLCDRFANRMMSAEECADAIRARGQA